GRRASRQPRDAVARLGDGLGHGTLCALGARSTSALQDGKWMQLAEVVGDDEAVAALEELEPSPADPIVIEPNSLYLSTGFNGDGEQQCDFAWLALRATGASEQHVRARFFFSDDAYWDWRAASPGVAGGISPSALLHICTDEPRGVEAPAGCDELVHVVDARRREAEDIAEIFSMCLPRNPEAVWTADLLGPRGARLAAPRLSACPTKESAAPPTLGAAGPRAAERAVAGHSAPFDGLLGDSALSARAAGPPLNLEPTRDELRARLAAARDRFASVLAERMAKAAKAPSAEAARGSSGPVAAAVASEGAAGEGVKVLAMALMAVLKSSATQAAGSSGAGAASDPLRAADGAAATRGNLLTIYLPQNPVQQIGVAAFREMRALAESIDFLLQCRILQALDILTQRLKAAQVAVGDGLWGAAKWLELTPAKDEPTTLRNEEEAMIRSIELGELKLEELSSRLRKPQ
ncbi:unnamed protein product, partial [Prorocentrum cordatum]